MKANWRLQTGACNEAEAEALMTDGPFAGPVRVTARLYDPVKQMLSYTITNNDK
jgi:hypothetical protein